MPLTTEIPRSSINQVFMLAPENAPGSLVSLGPYSRLGTFNSQIAPVGAGAFGLFRPSAGKYVGQVVPADIYAEGAFTDTVDYNTMPFLLAGNVGWIAGADGTGNLAGSTTWVHTPIPYATGTSRTYHVKEGDAGQVAAPAVVPALYDYSNVLIPDLNVRFMRTGASQVGGRVLGRKLAPSIVMPGTVTTRKGRSINGLKTGVFSATTWAGLAASTTRLLPIAMDVAWRHNGLFGPWFGLDDSIISFAGTLEQNADAGVQLTLLADVDTADMKGIFKYSNMEDGSPLFIKVVNIGSYIPGVVTPTPFSMTLSMALVISGPPRRSTVGPIRVWQWDAILSPDLDGTTHPPFEWTVVCQTAAAAIPAYV